MTPPCFAIHNVVSRVAKFEVVSAIARCCWSAAGAVLADEHEHFVSMIAARWLLLDTSKALPSLHVSGVARPDLT